MPGVRLDKAAAEPIPKCLFLKSHNDPRKNSDSEGQGSLQSMGSQRAGHNLVTEHQSIREATKPLRQAGGREKQLAYGFMGL